MIVANPGNAHPPELARARARARLRKTIRLRRAHCMRRRPLDLSHGNHHRTALIVAAILTLLLLALTLAVPVTAGAVATGVYMHYAQDLPPPDKLVQLKLGQST